MQWEADADDIDWEFEDEISNLTTGKDENISEEDLSTNEEIIDKNNVEEYRHITLSKILNFREWESLKIRVSNIWINPKLAKCSGLSPVQNGNAS